MGAEQHAARRSVAVLVHEMRGSLSTMRLWEYLARKSSKPERFTEALAAIRYCVDQQAQLLAELEASALQLTIKK